MEDEEHIIEEGSLLNPEEEGTPQTPKNTDGETASSPVAEKTGKGNNNFITLDYETLRALEEAKKLQEQEKKHAKERQIREAQAAVNEGEDDTAEEKVEREEARQMIGNFSGDAFVAVQKDDPEMLRAFFLVYGTKKMLGLRSKQAMDGGRTLLHYASFWGSFNCTKFLLQLGADPNVLDTAYSQVTPLLESVRAGHLHICKALIESGANVACQDAHGDSMLHWCARKGRGTMILHLLRIAEKATPGSTRELLLLENNRKRTCKDLAANESVLSLIERQIDLSQKMKADRSSKLHKGLAKAKLMGKNVGNARDMRAQKLRYSTKAQH